MRINHSRVKGVLGVSDGVYSMSSILSIGTDYDLSSPGLQEAAQAEGHWKAEDGPLDFTKAYNATFEGLSLSEKQQPANRLACGKALVQEKAKSGRSKS
jgi:hypothetical protein